MHLFRQQPRLLQPHEWGRLDAFQEYFGGAIPSPEVAQVVVVEQGNEIIGIMCMETIVHVGPVWVAPQVRGRGVFNRLLRKAYEIFPQWRGAVCFTDNPKVIQAAQGLGLERLKQVAFKWEKKNG